MGVKTMSNEVDDLVQDVDEGVLFDPNDTVIQRKIVGVTFDKKQLLGKKTTIVILGFGQNRFKKPVLKCNLEGEDVNLPLSDTNINELVEIFGEELKNWIGKNVKVEGLEWEGEIQGEHKKGVTLKFT